ncbi:XdhC family protein [Pseudahrensia aquimaris]|uniref:XdhC family protein n=1 Tax=Pseudahrensia aquimaris TaxID=744461 RepID=A0ABW3FGL2_9HYPH
MKASLLEAVNTARLARQAIAVVTDIASGEQHCVTSDEIAAHALYEELVKRFRSGKSGIVEREGVETFIAMHVPPPRLVVIGAVHISQALYPIAQACGFDVTIIDPRSAFATPERFAGVRLLAEWPQDIPEVLDFDAYTALAAVTHDPKIDDLPLQKALEAECFYVGALGSRKTHAKRLERLRSTGLSEEQTARIRAPIGLDIGAASPQEIAVAVMGEIIASLRKGAA